MWVIDDCLFVGKKEAEGSASPKGVAIGQEKGTIGCPDQNIDTGTTKIVGWLKSGNSAFPAED
jgi:hypothetical protein